MFSRQIDVKLYNLQNVTWHKRATNYDWRMAINRITHSWFFLSWAKKKWILFWMNECGNLKYLSRDQKWTQIWHNIRKNLKWNILKMRKKNRQTAVHIIFTTCLWMFSHKILVKARTIFSTDKETDESWEIFIIWKINFGLWAGRNYEKKRFGPFMSNFWGLFFKVFMGKRLI